MAAKLKDFGVRAILVVVVLGFLYVTFAPRTDHTSMFVAVHKERRDQLIGRIAAFLRDKGLRVDIGKASDDRGNTLTALKAVGGNIQVWIQNVPLSGEDKTVPCVLSPEPYPDPEQLQILVQSRFRILPNRGLPLFFDDIQNLLQQQGTPYQSAAWPCGAVALVGH
jgi:hypothetical protein